MKKVLITGATGTVGSSILNALAALNHDLEVFAGVRRKEQASTTLKEFKASPVLFDFTNSKTFRPALAEMDYLFLLRPPQISDVQQYFAPLLQVAKQAKISHIVFLSVQGAEKSKWIPHHKIEQLIRDSGIAYTFLRPAYFMQNFLTTLRSDLVEHQRIYLPAGKAKFTLIDVLDLGEVAAHVLITPEKFKDQAYAITNRERLTFGDMADKLGQGQEKPIKFKSPNLLSFFITKKKEGLSVTYILVLIMLHYLPRFQKTPPTTDWVKEITGKTPNTFKDFVETNKKALT